MSCWRDLVSLIVSMRFGDFQQDFPLPCFSAEDSHLWKSMMPSENRLDKGDEGEEDDEVVSDLDSQLDTSRRSSEVSVHSSDEGASRRQGKSNGEREKKSEKHRGGKDRNDTFVPPQDAFLLFQQEHQRRSRVSLHRSARKKTAGSLFQCSLSGNPSRRPCGDEEAEEETFSDFEEDEELVYALEEASGGKKFLQEEKVRFLFTQNRPLRLNRSSVYERDMRRQFSLVKNFSFFLLRSGERKKKEEMCRRRAALLQYSLEDSHSVHCCCVWQCLLRFHCMGEISLTMKVEGKEAPTEEKISAKRRAFFLRVMTGLLPFRDFLSFFIEEG